MQPMLLLKSNVYYIIRMCVCSVRYPAWNGQALFFHLQHSLLCTLYKIYHIIDMIFKKCLRAENMGFDFLYTVCEKPFFILDRNERDIIENAYWSSCKQQLFFYDLSKIEFSRHIFDKNLNIKLHENSYRRTDWQDEANSVFSQVCEGFYITQYTTE